MDIKKLDKNLFVKGSIDGEKYDIYSPLDAPFEVYGVKKPVKDGEKYIRLPKDVASMVSENILLMHAHTSGGKIEFDTNSPEIAIFVKYGEVLEFSHFSIHGSRGFDLYADNNYVGPYIPPFDNKSFYSHALNTNSNKNKQIKIVMPTYAEVSSIMIGVTKGSKIYAPTHKYINEKPVVFYGSSITHGACASKPSNAYGEIISRNYNINYINLGFSGSAKGEKEMADYIASLSMSAFIYDYDHNAPSVEHLNATHKPMFDIIRKAHKDIPIIMVSRPAYIMNEEVKQRIDVIYDTYKSAKANGDDNVYFINGYEMMKKCSSDGFIDCHPNDLGFKVMAEKIGEELYNAIVH